MLNHIFNVAAAFQHGPLLAPTVSMNDPKLLPNQKELKAGPRMTTPSTVRPEDIYHSVRDPAERRRIQAKVLLCYSGRIRDVVCRFEYRAGADRHWEDAQQAGCVGLLVALEKYNPDRQAYEPNIVPFFWNYARASVLDEVQKWFDRGVYWRPRRRRSNSGNVHLNRLHEPLVEEPVHETPTVEEIVAEAEQLALVKRFVAGLPEGDRHLLLGRVPPRRAGRYRELLQQARAYMMGGAT